MRKAAILAALLLACVAHGATSEPSLKSADLLAEAEAMGDRLVQWYQSLFLAFLEFGDGATLCLLEWVHLRVLIRVLDTT